MGRPTALLDNTLALPPSINGVMRSFASHFGCTSHVTTKLKASMTIQPQGKVPCSESYESNGAPKVRTLSAIKHYLVITSNSIFLA